MILYIHIYIYIYRREKLWFFFGGLPQTLIQINPSSLPLNLVTFDFAGRCCWLFDLSVEVTLIDLLQPHHLMLGMGLFSGAGHFERLPSRELTYPHLGKRKIIFKSEFWWDMLVPKRVRCFVGHFNTNKSWQSSVQQTSKWEKFFVGASEPQPFLLVGVSNKSGTLPTEPSFFFSGWWFQPIWKIFVKLGIFPRYRWK